MWSDEASVRFRGKDSSRLRNPDTVREIATDLAQPQMQCGGGRLLICGSRESEVNDEL